MAFTANKDARTITANSFELDVSKGAVRGHTHVNKFGRTQNADMGIDTDIWDRASTADDQAIWLQPTASRVHQITSSSSEDGTGLGGARTLELYGLPTWATTEVSETITMDTTNDVATSTSYVIVHRMKVLTKGSSSSNVGTITATADGDATVTAQINPGEGQTQMAIYGIPDSHTAFITKYYASAIKSQATIVASIKLLVNPEPDTETTNYVTKHTLGLITEGTNTLEHHFGVPYKVEGPAVIKIQVNASAADVDVSGGFDLILVANDHIV